MGQYDRQIATAKRLIAKYGQSVTWRQIRNGAINNAATPWKPSASEVTEKTAQIAFFPYTTENKQLLRHLLGTEVPVGSLTGYMPSVDFEPALKDTVVRDNKVLSIKSIDPISPNGQIILYTIQFEQSGNITNQENVNALGGFVEGLEDLVEALPEN